MRTSLHNALNTVSTAIKSKASYVSAEQLKVLRKGRTKLKKKIADYSQKLKQQGAQTHQLNLKF